jgi:hypothetical protein
MLDKLIQLSGHKMALLKELKESIVYENCIYDIRRISGRLYLFDIKTKKEIFCSNPKTWLDRRKIGINKVYNSHLLK